MRGDCNADSPSRMPTCYYHHSSEVLFGSILFYSVALRKGKESAVRDVLTEMHH